MNKWSFIAVGIIILFFASLYGWGVSTRDRYAELKASLEKEGFTVISGEVSIYEGGWMKGNLVWIKNLPDIISKAKSLGVTELYLGKPVGPVGLHLNWAITFQHEGIVYIWED